MIIGLFEGTINGGFYHVQIIQGTNGPFGTIRIDGKFFHRDNWGDWERSLVAACIDKTRSMKTMCERIGYGFRSVHGTIQANGEIVQNMDR